MSEDQREPSAEEKLKAKAEADKAAADAELAKFELEQKRRLMDFEVREAEAKAITAELLARYQDASTVQVELRTADIARQHAWEEAHDVYHRVYNFLGSVGSSSVRACIEQLNIWRRTDPGKPIEIVFHSPGGSVIDGMALYDHIQVLRSEGHHITTTAMGMAASMAGILLQAGDERVMSRESYLLIHEVSFGVGGKIGEVEDEVAFIKKIQDRVVAIFAERSKLSKAQVRTKWRRKDWWLDSTEALDLGLIDTIR